MKFKHITILLISLIALAACSGQDGEESDSENTDDATGSDELTALEVDFVVPEQVDVGETVELKAVVTYGDEDVTDAEEMNFEYWEKNDEDNSVTVESTNNEDGTYTAEVTFEKDGIFEMFAHTTARDQHTMPLESIIVGDGADMEYEESDDESESDESEESHDH